MCANKTFSCCVSAIVLWCIAVRVWTANWRMLLSPPTPTAWQFRSPDPLRPFWAPLRGLNPTPATQPQTALTVMWRQPPFLVMLTPQSGQGRDSRCTAASDTVSDSLLKRLLRCRQSSSMLHVAGSWPRPIEDPVPGPLHVPTGLRTTRDPGGRCTKFVLQEILL